MFAPNSAKLISLALFSIPALGAIISSSITLVVDELLRGVVCIDGFSSVLDCDLTLVDSIVNWVVLSANALPDDLTSSDRPSVMSPTNSAVKEAVELLEYSIDALLS